MNCTNSCFVLVSRANFDRRALQLGAVKISNVPENLQCGVCKGLLKDAVVLTCCGKSCCDDCE